MLKIGLAGVGHLGKIHANCINMIDDWNFVGFYDPAPDSYDEIINNYQLKRFDSFEDLVDEVDVIDIVTPTIYHFELAKYAISKGKHVFIEKPVCKTVEEAKELESLSKKNNVKIQVGHVERFNPAFLAIKDIDFNPKFIEVHRLSQFNPRGTDVPVILDLMIHDLDILLKIVPSKVKDVKASGVSIVSKSADICNARIEFENGCVANVTASRLSLKNMRKIRLFQNDAYISIDFLEKDVQLVQLDDVTSEIESNPMAMILDTANGKKSLNINIPEIKPVNAIKMELELFLSAIIKDIDTEVTISDAIDALELSMNILNIVENLEHK